MPGIWHNKMEEYFEKESQEQTYICKTKNENTQRRADVILNNNYSLEIQHSFIKYEDVNKRKKDWEKFGKQIIWFIDSNTKDVIIDYLDTSKRYLIQFNEPWKFNSFKDYDYILLEKDNKIYKINPNNVKNKMIDVKECIDIDIVINKLKEDPINICSLWKEDITEQCNLTIYQKGAGNGKTYGIWKSICENNEKETFVIVTKQHSAKSVIYQELLEQTERDEEHILENIENIKNEHTSKQYVIKYKNIKTDRHCIIIIGTIDSFCYNLSEPSSNDNDKFHSILKNIIKEGSSKLSTYGGMNYAKQFIYLNKLCELWIDEAQDLNQSYLRAITRIMRDTYIDVCIVGDKLQSLQYNENIMTNLENNELPNIKIHHESPENINRRIKVPKLHSEINKIINFDKYNLPEININNLYKRLEKSNDNFNIIDTPKFYADDTDENKISNYVDDLIKIVDKEVNNNLYYPENFMFIFPIMKKNILSVELETKLNNYWINKFNDKVYLENLKKKITEINYKMDDNDKYWDKYKHNKYTQYAILHKHELGQVIDTEKSIHSTRIMSIQTSKGDGREVIFILGCTERNLNLVSSNQELLYESHLHVALTRVKEKIYFGLERNKDDIHSRIQVVDKKVYLPDINKNISIDKIKDFIDINAIMKILIENNITEDDYLEETIVNNNKEIIDWGYHCIRYAVYYYSIIFNIINNGKIDSDNYKKLQLKIILNKLSKLEVQIFKPKEYYNFLTEYQWKDIPSIPICDLSNREVYKNLEKKIKKKIKDIKLKLKNINKKKIEVLEPLESTILVHMLQISRQQRYAETSINDIYNIMHFYEDNNNKEKEFINQVKDVNTNINKMLKDIDTYGKNILWNIEHTIKYTDKKDFEFKKNTFPIIGYNDNYVFHILLKTNISSLNFWDIFIDILLERFIIQNPHNDNNKKKYKNKKIISYIVLLKENMYKKLNWEWDINILIETKIKEELKKAFIIYFQDYHAELYEYLNFIKKEKLWKKEDFNTPIDFMYSKLNEIKLMPNYIISFFNNLKDKNKEERNNICNGKIKFCNSLKEKLIKECDIYFKLNIEEEDDY